MSSISSDNSHVSLDSSSDNSALISSGSSMASMNTRDHNELYDHRQHPDFDNNIENTTTLPTATQTNSTAMGPQITNVVTDVNNNNSNNNTVTTPGSNKTPEKSGLHYATHQSPIPLPGSSKSMMKSPVPQPTHRYRRYSHQSYLGPPPFTSFYQQSHGPTDPVIEAAELASHKFNSSARPSRLEQCIQVESLPSPYPNIPTPVHNPHNFNNIQFIDRKESLPNSNNQKPHSARRLSKIHSSADPISPRMNLRKTRSDSISSQFDTRNVSGNSNATTTAVPNNSNTHVTSKTNPLGDSNNHGSAIKLTRTKSSESNNAQGLNRKTTRGSYDSDDSQGSRDTQETEEDVCFPMEPQLHTRANGIDFDELEEFAQYTSQMREEYLASMRPNSPESKEGKMDISTSSGTSLSRMSSAALKYTPRPSAQQAPSSSQSNSSESKRDSEEEEAEKVSYVSPLPELPGVQFDTRNKIEGEDEHENAYQSRYFTQDYTPTDYSNNNFVIPNRFSFFCSDSEETIHTTDIASLVTPGQSFYDLFRGGEPTWWLDCTCPTDDEMRCLAKAFGIHPLTAEDIRIQETREKVELFKSYYFVCFHTFENDKESEDFLEPINVYLVVFRTGILSFHFGPISHCASVRRRVRQLRDYVDVNSDWLCYALIDDITDSFAPVIQSIEYEADVIEDSVFMARDVDFSAMLQRIGESRKKTMTLMRLLSGKADVIKMFAKRCQEEANGIGPALTSDINIANLHAGDYSDGQRAQPRGDIAMYLGDIQDHLLTMYQNLAAYEKIFSRSHTNYLAQLQVESFNSNNKVTDILGKATIIGTIFVPLNVITGLFGMNVKVPGQDSSIAWWFGILGVLIGLACGGFIFSTYWIGRITPPTTLNEAAESGATSVIPSIFGKGRSNKRRNFQDPRINPTTGSINSLPSRLSRYK